MKRERSVHFHSLRRRCHNSHRNHLPRHHSRRSCNSHLLSRSIRQCKYSRRHSKSHRYIRTRLPCHHHLYRFEGCYTCPDSCRRTHRWNLRRYHSSRNQLHIRDSSLLRYTSRHHSSSHNRRDSRSKTRRCCRCHRRSTDTPRSPQSTLNRCLSRCRHHPHSTDTSRSLDCRNCSPHRCRSYHFRSKSRNRPSTCCRSRRCCKSGPRSMDNFHNLKSTNCNPPRCYSFRRRNTDSSHNRRNTCYRSRRCCKFHRRNTDTYRSRSSTCCKTHFRYSFHLHTNHTRYPGLGQDNTSLEIHSSTNTTPPCSRYRHNHLPRWY